MNNLTKVRDISLRYDITARALKYYEDVGLLTSTQSDGYAYRMYDEAAVMRLEQILILRKLDISIKDIQRIFNDAGSSVVLEVLGKKAQNIDDEVALLHELKSILLDFISEIEGMNFTDNSDIKSLYDKAKEINTQMISVDSIGKPSNVNRLLEVTEKLRKVAEVKIIEIPNFRAVTSGYLSEEEIFSPGGFDEWLGKNNRIVRDLLYASPDFMSWSYEEGTTVWDWAVHDWVTEEDVAPYKLKDFEGGLYATATCVDGDPFGNVYSGIKEWLASSGFELDERPGHRMLCHMPTPTEDIKKGLGYQLLDIFVPIRLRRES